MGQGDDDILHRLCNLPLRSIKPLGGGASITLKAVLEGGDRAAVKPRQLRVTNYVAEVAAYRVSRALRLSAVAPSCVRLFPRQQLTGGMPPSLQARMAKEMLDDGKGQVPAAVIHWIPELRSLRLEKLDWWKPLVRRGTPLPPEKRRRVLEISTQVLFDFLIVNDDRWSGGNTHESGDQMVYLDQGAGFGNDRRGSKRRRLTSQLTYCQRFSKEVAAALRGLDLPALKRELRGLVSAEEVQQFSDRVGQAREYLDRLSREAPEDSLL